MFGASPGVRLEKREERGLVRTRTLRRWGTPLNAPDTPGERHKSWSRRRSRAPAPAMGHSNHRRAMLRRCSLFDISGGSFPSGASVWVERPAGMLQSARTSEARTPRADARAPPERQRKQRRGFSAVLSERYGA